MVHIRGTLLKYFIFNVTLLFHSTTFQRELFYFLVHYIYLTELITSNFKNTRSNTVDNKLLKCDTLSTTWCFSPLKTSQMVSFQYTFK